MARPLNPSLDWQDDHFRFRCRFKDGGRPWIDLPAGLSKTAAAARALELATLAQSGALTRDGDGEADGDRMGATATATVRTGPRETVKEWCERWIEEREERGLASASHDRARMDMHVLPIIGSRPVGRITSREIERVVTHLDKRVRAGKMSWKTAVNVWGNVTKAFDDAAHSKDPTLRVRADNPAVGIRGPDRGVKKVKAFLFPNEAHALLACEAVPLAFRRAATLAIYLGLRAGELRALQWADIDLDHGTIHVHRGFDREANETKSTKGKAARRFTFEANLRPLLEAMHREAEGRGLVLDQRWFWSSATELREHLRTAGVTRADLFETDETRKNVTFHDLRATTLTWMAIRGDDPLKIRARAGHSDLQTTEGYIRTAGEIEGAIGEVFGPLPPSLGFNGHGEARGPEIRSASMPFGPQTSDKMQRAREDSNPAKVAKEATNELIIADHRQDRTRSTPSPAVVSNPLVSTSDSVESALAEALRKATEEGRWDAVIAIAETLRTRS